jgi:hypothetical protein
MKIIWIVSGATGEWDDYQCWDVAAYPTKILATRHTMLAKKWLDDNRCYVDKNKKWNNPYDPYMQIDYNGTTWGVRPVPFKDKI